MVGMLAPKSAILHGYVVIMFCTSVCGITAYNSRIFNDIASSHVVHMICYIFIFIHHKGSKIRDNNNNNNKTHRKCNLKYHFRPKCEKSRSLGFMKSR